jgi:hypothetical protein
MEEFEADIKKAGNIALPAAVAPEHTVSSNGPGLIETVPIILCALKKG